MFNVQWWLSLQLPARSIAAATLVVATLGDVLFARCSGSSLRVNLLPTHLAAFSISAVATFRVPRPSGDGYNAGGYIALWLTPQSRLSG